MVNAGGGGKLISEAISGLDRRPVIYIKARIA